MVGYQSFFMGAVSGARVCSWHCSSCGCILVRLSWRGASAVTARCVVHRIALPCPLQRGAFGVCSCCCVRRFRFLGFVSLACSLLLCSFVGRIWCIFVACASVWLCPIAMMLHARTYCYWVKGKGWRRDGGFVGLYALFPCKRSLKHEVLVQKAS